MTAGLVFCPVKGSWKLLLEPAVAVVRIGFLASRGSSTSAEGAAPAGAANTPRNENFGRGSVGAAPPLGPPFALSRVWVAG